MRNIVFAALAALVVMPWNGSVIAAENGQTLPPICTANAPSAPAGANSTSQSTTNMGGMDMGGMSDMGGPGNDDNAHKAMMAGMQSMQDQMMAGMSATDIDVAFVCGMIPHHQGAIDMAQAELRYGKDDFTRKLAQDIIAAQQKEIAEMLDWLGKHAK